VSNYILSVDAGLDLDAIWEYIAADNIDAATVGWKNCSMRLKPSDKLLAWGTVGTT
jgi:hypothetical protein